MSFDYTLPQLIPNKGLTYTCTLYFCSYPGICGKIVKYVRLLTLTQAH